METLNYHCPNCDAPVVFSAKAQAMMCSHCGAELDPQELETHYAARIARFGHEAAASETSEGRPRESQIGSVEGAVKRGGVVCEHAGSGRFQTERRFLERAPWAKQDEDELRAYTCSSCGAVLALDRTAAASTCPYCGNAVVMRGILAGSLTPDLVAPFEISQEQATSAIKAHVDKLLVPKAFKEQLNVQHAAGIYVPFWLYSATISGTYTFALAHQRNSFKSEYVVFQKSTDVSCSFENIPVDASTKMPDGYMDALEPFDCEKLVPFASSYLSGFCAECRDLGAWDCKERAIVRMSNTVSADVQRRLEESSVQFDQHSCELCMPYTCKASVKWDSISCALLPVWMMHATWNGADYLLAMNGQTGKMSSRLPLSHARRNLLFGGVFAITGIVAIALICAMWGSLVAEYVYLHTLSTGFVKPFALATAAIATAAYAIPSIITFKQMQRLRTATERANADAQKKTEISFGEVDAKLIEQWKANTENKGKLDRYSARMRKIATWKVDAGRASFAAAMPDAFSKEGRSDAAEDASDAAEKDADAIVVPPPHAHKKSDRRINKHIGMHWRDALYGWRRD